MSMTLHGKCMLLHDVGLINRRCLSSSKDINQTRNEVFHFSPIYVVINGGEEVDHSTLKKKLEMKSIKSTTHKIFRVLDSLEKKIGDIDAREAENDTKAIDLLFRGVSNNEKNKGAGILHHKYKQYLENPLRDME